ncbi:MAG: hypothetical protein P4M12_01990 [Gammaproteobacteria bacterium]|nr:hypothetical protein [Gammaproteobacteria bacterium]
MMNRKQEIPLPAKVSKAQVIQLLNNYQKHRSFADIKIFADPKPLIELRQFAHHLPEAGILNLKTLFELSKILYQLELYDYFHNTAHKDKVDDYFKVRFGEHSSRQPHYKLAKKVEFLRNAIDELLGARSAAFRKLYYFTYYSRYKYSFDFDYERLLSAMNDVYRNRFQPIIFETLCRVPEECAVLTANLIGDSVGSTANWSIKQASWICSLIPNQFDPAYLNFLPAFTRSKTTITRKDYEPEIAYGLFWLQKGKIDTPFNKEKLIYYAELMEELTRINPNTEGLGEVEIQERYQHIFNNGLKKVSDTTKNVLLSGIRNTQTSRMLWKFFGTNPQHEGLPNHALAELNVIDHVMSFLQFR